jgi:hypothetical protein
VRWDTVAVVSLVMENMAIIATTAKTTNPMTQRIQPDLDAAGAAAGAATGTASLSTTIATGWVPSLPAPQLVQCAAALELGVLQ